jgi:Mce-associated membrane protein
MTRLLRGVRTRESTGRAGEPAPADAPEEGAAVETATEDAPGPSADDTRPGALARVPDEIDGTGEFDGTGGTGDTRGTADTTGAEGAGPADEAPTPRRPSARLRRITIAVTAAVLVLAGSGFFYGAHQVRSTASAHNRALTDTEATTRVAGDVGNALAHVFSYTPDGLDAAEHSARAVLDGRAARQYTELLDRIRADVTKQHVTLSTQAVRVGVIELDADDARLLVFLDQISRRDKGAATSVAAQLTVTARREGDQWRIVDIKAR